VSYLSSTWCFFLVFFFFPRSQVLQQTLSLSFQQVPFIPFLGQIALVRSGCVFRQRLPGLVGPATVRLVDLVSYMKTRLFLPPVYSACLPLFLKPFPSLAGGPYPFPVKKVLSLRAFSFVPHSFCRRRRRAHPSAGLFPCFPSWSFAVFFFVPAGFLSHRKGTTERPFWWGYVTLTFF